jgi:hypothetical protein
MLKDLVYIANKLDSLGFYKKASTIDFYIQKFAEDDTDNFTDVIPYNKNTYNPGHTNVVDEETVEYSLGQSSEDPRKKELLDFIKKNADAISLELGEGSEFSQKIDKTREMEKYLFDAKNDYEKYEKERDIIISYINALFLIDDDVIRDNRRIRNILASQDKRYNPISYDFKAQSLAMEVIRGLRVAAADILADLLTEASNYSVIYR